MRKLILALSLLLLINSRVAASDNLLIRLEQPKTPTDDREFPITFVVLDIVGGSNIDVACDSQFEGGATTQFYSTTLTSGGNTGSCPITNSVVNDKGNYKITVRASSTSGNSSESVSFYYDNESPETPKDYGKNKVGDCKYEIKFKTADDGGKTAKVEIYRSTETSFKADNGSRIAEYSIGSNTEKSHTDTVPDCNKTYYYAVRAFNDSGNGSGIVGDSIVNIIESDELSETTVTETASQAIPVGSGAVLGVTRPETEGTTGEQGRVLGVEEGSESATLSAMPSTEEATSSTKAGGIDWGSVILLSGIGALLILIYRRLVK